MRRYTHDRAIAIAHQHIVANPHFHLRTRQRMRHEQARGHALFLLRGQLGFGRAALFAFFQESSQLGVAGRGMQSQCMFRGDRAKRHTHDGVGAGGEDKHAAIVNQLAVRACDVVRERKTHTFAFANPVFLHQTHFVGPAVQGGFGVAHLHMVEQLLCVIGDLQIVARDLALFDHRAGAPAFAVNHLLVGQHGLVHRVPVHHLGFAVGDAFFQHLQKQPLVPFVIGGVAGGHFARPVDGQAHRLHLLLHVSNVVVGPLGRGYAVFQGGVFGRQTKRIPTHGHQDVVALHAQMAREHVVDGVVAHMAHVQLAAGVRQHRAGVVLGAAVVFGDAVNVCIAPSGLDGLFNVGCFVVGAVVAAGLIKWGWGLLHGAQ